MDLRDLSDAALAHTVAAEAGALLMELRASGGLTGKALGDRGDRLADDLILARLAEARPGEFVLSEESLDDKRRCAEARVWVVDPLDGTLEYVEGSDDWAVHVALAEAGVPIAGAVAVPALGAVFATDDVKAAGGSLPARARMAVSRTRCPALAERVGAAMGADFIRMGSAGAKAMAVVDGRADLYLHDGGQYEWDNCAPVAVALAAGLHASRIDGSPLRYNCENPLLPDLLICRPELAEQALKLVRELR